MKLSVLVALCAFTSVASAADPTFSFVSKGLYFPASRGVEFPYKSLGAKSLKVKLSRAYENNLNAYELKSWDQTHRMTCVAERRLDLAPPYDKEQARLLRLDDVVKDLKPGLYRLEADTGLSVRRSWWWGREPVRDERIFVLTDLGLAIMASPGGEDPKASVVVNSFKTGAPVEGVTVQLLTRANQTAGVGTTDKNGRADIRLLPSFRACEDELHGVLAKKGSDMSYLELGYSSKLTSRDEEQDHFMDPRAYLFAERDICRPGEAFETGLFLRTSPQAGLKALGKAPVDLELYDAADNRVETRRVTTDRWGFVPARWEIPASARVGSWRVVAKLADHSLGSFTVQVAAYVPDRFRVEVTIDAGKDVVPKKAPTLKGTATYYFGDPVRDAKYRLRAAAVGAAPAEHWKGWTVGDKVGELPDCEGEGEITDGTFSDTIPIKMLTAMLMSTKPVLLLARAEVTPPGARTVSSRAEIRINPSSRYIGLREADGARVDRRDFDLVFLPARKGDKVVVTPADEVKVSIFRKEWQCHLVESGSSYEREWREDRTELTNLVQTVHPPTNAAPCRFSYPADALEAGCYELVATSGALATRMEFWHWAGEVSERSVSPSELYLKANVVEAKPWSKVKLSFAVPKSGLAYVVAGERGIEYTDTFPVKPGENSFEIPVRNDVVAAEVYAAVTVVCDNAPKERRLFGVARIPVDHADRHYPCEISMADVVRPCGDLEIRIKAAGAGAVRLMAVDEGVLALTGYTVPSIFLELYDHSYGSPFGVYDVYSEVYPDLKILPNGQIGGGGRGVMRRRNVRTRRDSTVKQRETARVVMPLVEIPASGETTVTMKMPDFVGAMRVMAVAVDDSRASSMDKSVIVRDAASLFVNAPRCAAGGDRFKLVAEIFNHDLPAGDWSLVIDGRTFAGHLAKGGSTNVAFDVTLPKQAFGRVRFAGTLKMGGETFRDVVYTSVRPLVPPVTRVTYALGKAKDTPKPPVATTDWLRLDEDVTEVAPAPVGALKTALSWLNAYPYGCLEQTTATAFPLLAAESLRKLGLANAASVSNSEKRIKSAYANIIQMARDDGSFAMWPGGGETWADGTLFALHFIFAAEARGLIKPNPRQKYVTYLRKQVNRNDQSSRLSRAYAAYILSLAGDDHFAKGAVNLLSQKERDFASFLAAAALVTGGHNSEGALAFREAVAARVWETSHEPDSVCWSRLRMRAMALAIATRVLPATGGDAKGLLPIVSKLMDDLRSDDMAWGTTRDNAWASMALATFCAAQPTDFRFSSRIQTGIPKALPPASGVLSVTRRLPKRVKHGDLVTVELEIRAKRHVASAVLCDLLPGGLELEDSTLKTRAGGDDEDKKSSGRSEIRDDRWLWFGSLDAMTKKNDPPLKLVYRARAVTRGTFAVPAVTIEDMYDPDANGRQDAAGTITVE